MSVARRLVRAWDLVREAGVALFEPGVSAAIVQAPGWGAIGLPADPSAPTTSVTDALRALKLLSVREQEGSHRVAIVATMPPVTREFATTRDALLELVETAQRELLLLGFGLTDKALTEAMVACAERGVQITVVGERTRDDLLSFARNWPAIVKPAMFLQMVEPANSASALMHAKVVVVDRQQMLLGSANFTSGGLNSNFELGVRIDGPAAESVCRLVELLTTRCWFEPLKL